MKDVFGYIKATPDREYLLRASYLEIYNEQIHDLLASGVGRVPVALTGTGFNVTMSPLREEVVTSLKAVREVMERGESNRRTATTDWNERSSRSHSVFRLVSDVLPDYISITNILYQVIESRERGSGSVTPTATGPPAPGGARLNAKGSSGVRMSVLVNISCYIETRTYMSFSPSSIWLVLNERLPTKSVQRKENISTQGREILSSVL